MTTQIGRNQPCPCGSRRKYKRCCLNKNANNHPNSRSTSPSANGFSPQYLQRGFELPSIKELKLLSWADLRNSYFGSTFGAALSAVLRELSTRADPSAFETRRLPRGETEFVFQFPRSSISPPSPLLVSSSGKTHAGLAQVRIQDLEMEKAGGVKVSFGICSCNTDKNSHFCDHLPAALYALWSMMHRKVPIPWDILLYEPKMDVFLSRQPRPDPDLGIQLDAVLFCPPMIHQQDSAEGTGSDSLQETLLKLTPQQKNKIINGAFASYEYDQHLEDLISPNFRESHYYKPFETPRPSAYHRGNYSQATAGKFGNASSVEKSLQYLFSNGCVLTAGELVRHRWAKKVHRDFLPLQDSSSLKSSLIPKWASLSKMNPQPWTAEKERLDSQTALRALERALKHSVPVCIVDSQDRLRDRKWARVGAITIAPTKIRLEVRPGPLHNQLAIEVAEIAQREAGHADPTNLFPWKFLKGQIVLNNESILLEVGKEVGRAGEDSLRNATVVDFDRTVASVEGQMEIQTSIGRLQSRLLNLDLPQAMVPVPQVISPEQVNFELWLNPKGTLQVSWKLKELDLRVWNISPSFQSWLFLLQSGIVAQAEADPKEIAFGRAGAKRDLDLKILRHTGFAACLVLEVLSYALKGVTSTGEKFENRNAFDKWLDTRLTVLALKISASPDAAKQTELKSLVSERVLALIKNVNEFTHSICTRPLPRLVYLADRVVSIPNRSADIAQLLLALLSHVSKRTQGACFLKAKTPAALTCETASSASEPIDIFAVSTSSITEQSGQAVQTYLPFASAPQEPLSMLYTCLPLMQAGADIHWTGKSVGLLSPDDLKTVFELREGANSQQASGGALDWFELNPKVFLMGKEIDRDKLQEISKEGTIEHQGRLFIIPQANLPSLRRLSSFWERLQTSKTKKFGSSSWDDSGGHYQQLPKSETLEFLMLGEELQAEIRGQASENSKWHEIHQFYKSLDKPRLPVPLPPTIHAELKPYQNTGFQWLHDLFRLRLGGILADEMGLGKTLQTLAFLEFLRCEGRLGPSLIIVPTSLTWNWKSEAAKFTPELPILVFNPKKRAEIQQQLDLGSASPPGLSLCPPVLIVTYGLLIEHEEWFLGTDQAPRKWNLVVFDEAQNLKNFKSKRTGIARSLRADHKYCLTGTPLENHVGELFSLLDIVVPGCLGDYSGFNTLFNEIFSPAESALELAFLRKKIKPLLLRRTKSAILSELPPKIETCHKLPLETQQRKIYRDIAFSWNRQVDESILKVGESKSKLMMLTALLRLRQVCSDPATLPKVQYTKTPPKFELLGSSLLEIIESGESAIVFTQFVGTLERLTHYLQTLGIDPLCIHGAVSRKERENILQDFQSPLAPNRVLIMTLKTGGVGLNLTRARYVFHLEPWWNPAVENQATDRAHRIGQQGSVQVYRYVMQDTVEEKIEILKTRKASLFDAVLNETLDLGELSENSAEDSNKPVAPTLTRKDFDLLLSN